MKLFLNNLIPRLKEFSASLDRIEIFVDKPWVIIDENLNQQKYIFKRDGSLIMSLNGKVTIGKWEHLSSAQSLLIDRIQDKILLNQNFIDPGVMILKTDGLKDENFILANELIIPDLDITTYLKRLYYKNNNIATVKLKSGKILEVYNYTGILLRNKLTIDGEPVSDGQLELESEKKLFVRDSKLVYMLETKKYETNKGTIYVEQRYASPEKGDLVYQDNKPAPDGKYRLAFMYHIVVKNGKIK